MAHSPLTFKRVLLEMTEADAHAGAPLWDQLSVRVTLPGALEQVFRAVPMSTPGGGSAETEKADIRDWYNRIFLPRVEGDSPGQR